MGTGQVLEDGGVVLTREQVDLLIEALLSNGQLRKGRRAWLVNMLGRKPDGSSAKPEAQQATRQTHDSTDTKQGQTAAHHSSSRSPDDEKKPAQVESCNTSVTLAGQGGEEKGAFSPGGKADTLLQCFTDELLAGERNEKERQRRREREQSILRSVGLVGCGEIAVSYVACLTACGGQVTHVYDAGTAYVSSIRQHTSAYVSIRQRIQ